MLNYSRQLLSASTNGRGIAVAATGSPGTLVHAAVAGTGVFDEVYIWASNISGSAVLLTLQWGGVAASDQMVKDLSIQANSQPIPISVGQVLQNGLSVRAFAGSANVINLTGYVNRIS